MKFKTDSGPTYKAPEGTHIARCVWVVDLGTQIGDFNGEPWSRPQVLITWELPAELIDDPGTKYHEQPHLVSRTFTRSLHERSALNAWLRSWRSKSLSVEEKADPGTFIKKLVGAPGMITLAENEKGYVNAVAMAGLPKGTTAPAQITPSVFFDLDAPDMKAFEALPVWVQDKIKKSPEYSVIKPQGQVNSYQDIAFDGDDIPF